MEPRERPDRGLTGIAQKLTTMHTRCIDHENEPWLDAGSNT